MRTYHIIKCPNCRFPFAIKYGRTKTGIQRYMCKSCGYQHSHRKHKRVRVLKKGVR